MIYANAAMILVVLLGLLFLLRNEAVYYFRIAIIDAIPLERYGEFSNAYHSVTYNEMMLKFWRPLRSFYPEDFLRELGLMEASR